MIPPSQAYLASILAPFASLPAPLPQDTLDMPADTITPGGAQMAPPPIVAYGPGPSEAWQPPDPLAGLAKQNAPGAGAMTGYDPLLDHGGGGAPPPAPVNLPSNAAFAGVKTTDLGGPPPAAPPMPGAPIGPPPPPPPQVGAMGQPPDHNAFDLVPGATGGSPARELDLRGPKMHAAQDERNQVFGDAIGTMADRNLNSAADEYGMALDQERQARDREAAMQQSFAERDEEMQQRQADFDATTKQLSRLGTIDRNRFWATRSTGGKVASFVEMMLAGLRNAPSYVHKAIDDDVKAQEFAYTSARDQTSARQTAFSMAMQKYQNIDASRAIARAAAIDVTQSQLALLAAKHHGTDAANHATAAIADLQNEKLMQFQQAYRFMPAQGGARYYRDANGLIYNEAQAHAYAKEQRDRGFEERKQTAGIGGQLLVEDAKHNRENPGGISKGVRDKLDEDELKATRERDANLNAIGNAQQNINAVTKGGTLGEAYSHAPAWLPGVEAARKNSGVREAYNRRAMLAVAAAYKLSTDATEPKRKEMLEHFAEPYTILPSDNSETANNRMVLLRQLLEDGAASKGVTPTTGAKSATMPDNFGKYK